MTTLTPDELKTRIAATDSPWQDQDVLCELYWGDPPHAKVEIGRKLGCNSSTVGEWMSRMNIPTRVSERVRMPASTVEQLRDKEALEERLERGEDLKEIALDVGTGSVLVEDWLVYHGLVSKRNRQTKNPKKRPKLPKVDPERGTPWEDRQTLASLYWDEGLTIAGVADRLGCKDHLIAEWMGKLAVPRRDAAEAMLASTNKIDADPSELSPSMENLDAYRPLVDQMIADSGEEDYAIAPWRSYDILAMLHGEYDLRPAEMAAVLGCHHGTVTKWLYDLDVESYVEAEPYLRNQTRGCRIDREIVADLGLSMGDELSLAEPCPMAEAVGHGPPFTPAEHETLADAVKEAYCPDSHFPWQFPRVLASLYFDAQFDARQIADHYGCARRTVTSWLGQYELPKFRLGDDFALFVVEDAGGRPSICAVERTDPVLSRTAEAIADGGSDE